MKNNKTVTAARAPKAPKTSSQVQEPELTGQDFKRRYGRCEDAPCCGCCGQTGSEADYEVYGGEIQADY